MAAERPGEVLGRLVTAFLERHDVQALSEDQPQLLLQEAVDVGA
nr:hypothetical protein [Streptomyces sp. RPA4-2]